MTLASAAVHALPVPHLGGEPGRLVLWLHGDQDLATVDTLREVLDAVVAAGDGDLVIDLSGVTFLDASVLGALVGSRRVLHEQDCSLSLRAPPRAVRLLLDLCALEELVAVASLGPSGWLRS